MIVMNSALFSDNGIVMETFFGEFLAFFEAPVEHAPESFGTEAEGMGWYDQKSTWFFGAG